MTPNEQTAVEACPHCGCLERDQDEGQPMVELDNEDVTGLWFVVCHGCGARSGLFFEYANAVEAWNHRALLEASPTVPVSRWIPVTEAFPRVDIPPGFNTRAGSFYSKKVSVLLCDERESVDTFVITRARGSDEWYRYFNRYSCVIAWQPLDEAPQ